jgi:catalase
MSDANSPAPMERPPLGWGSVLVRLTLIVVALAAAVGAFAFLGGWLTPNELTPAKIVDTFEQLNGVHDGFRRNHAKGMGVSGYFESNGNGARLSKAAVFRPGPVPVIGRFSLAGGQPYAADKPDSVRGLGLQFALPDGEFWRTAMINLPVFPVRTAEAFYEQLLASAPDPQTGKPVPAKMQAFLAAHPESARALEIIKSEPFSSGFHNSTFHSLNAFRFVNAQGVSVPVRWILSPLRPIDEATARSNSEDKNYLFLNLAAQVHLAPVQWDLIIIVGQPGDPTADATIPWPATREQVNVGTLTLDKVQAEEDSPATDLNFDPLVLPAGIEPSDDPLLSARSAVYSQSFTRRAGEPKQRGAVTPADLPKNPTTK